MCKYCENQVLKTTNIISNIDGADNGSVDPEPMFVCGIQSLNKNDFKVHENKQILDYFKKHPATLSVVSPNRLSKLLYPNYDTSPIYIHLDILYCPFCGRKLGGSPKDVLE